MAGMYLVKIWWQLGDWFANLCILTYTGSTDNKCKKVGILIIKNHPVVVSCRVQYSDYIVSRMWLKVGYVDGSTDQSN